MKGDVTRTPGFDRLRGEAGYPFSAIVGQEELKKALLLCLVHPGLKGLLVKGERGTGKSTAVRSITRLMPIQRCVAGCPYGCDPGVPEHACSNCSVLLAEGGELEVVERHMPFVNLPVGTTEDRILGDIDLSIAMKEGKKKFSPGLLAEANRGVLYVDEVNLLPDHIVDVLLDAAAMGMNVVEREGVRAMHPSRFILIGTMNPEEGDLRPQLTDRFDLSVQVTAVSNEKDRVKVLERRLEFEADPNGFNRSWQEREQRVVDSLARAKALLRSVRPARNILEKAARISNELGVDGHRAEIAAVKAACGLAALDGVVEVSDEHLLQAVLLAYPHRLRKGPFDQEEHPEKQVRQTLDRLKQRDPPESREATFSDEKKK